MLGYIDEGSIEEDTSDLFVKNLIIRLGIYYIDTSSYFILWSMKDFLFSIDESWKRRTVYICVENTNAMSLFEKREC